MHRNATMQVVYHSFFEQRQDTTSTVSFSMTLLLPELKPWPINDLGFAVFCANTSGHKQAAARTFFISAKYSALACHPVLT